MQILEVLRTLEWLKSAARSLIDMLGKGVRVTSKQGPDPYLSAIYEHSRLSATLRANPSAVTVLKAFDLGDAFLHPDRVLRLVSMEESAEGIGSRMYQRIYRELVFPWNQMESCLEPLKELTIPAALTSSEAPEDILTVNISEREHLDLKTLTKTLLQLEALYETVERIHGADPQYPPLELVKIESGTDVRIDVKGLGKPIKEIKNLILETWTKHRHKRVDEIVDHNRAVASSIELLEEIDRKVKKGNLSDEDGNRFKRAIVSKPLASSRTGL